MEGRAQQCCAPTDLLLQQNVSDRRSVIVVVDTGRGEAAPCPLLVNLVHRITSIAEVYPS